jgi:DnaJ-class molecular chaperone
MTFPKGQAPVSGYERCPSCHGSGKIPPDAFGGGWKSARNTCPTCIGVGQVKKEREKERKR